MTTIKQVAPSGLLDEESRRVAAAAVAAAGIGWWPAFTLGVYPGFRSMWAGGVVSVLVRAGFRGCAP